MTATCCGYANNGSPWWPDLSCPVRPWPGGLLGAAECRQKPRRDARGRFRTNRRLSATSSSGKDLYRRVSLHQRRQRPLHETRPVSNVRLFGSRASHQKARELLNAPHGTEGRTDAVTSPCPRKATLGRSRSLLGEAIFISTVLMTGACTTTSPHAPRLQGRPLSPDRRE
jgi:hypothetical protein